MVAGKQLIFNRRKLWNKKTSGRHNPTWYSKAGLHFSHSQSNDVIPAGKFPRGSDLLMKLKDNHTQQQ